MDIETIRNYCLQLPETTEEFPFDEWTLVFKVAGKMFGLLPLNAERASLSLKCDPELAVELRETYPDVQPGYHLHKRYWNTVFLTSALNDELIKKWILHSYIQVVQKMPKARRELLSEKLRPFLSE